MENLLIAICGLLAMYIALVLVRDAIRRKSLARFRIINEADKAVEKTRNFIDRDQTESSPMKAPPLFRRVGKNTRNIKTGKVYELQDFESEEPYIINEKLKKSYIIFKASGSWEPANDSAKELLAN